MAQSEYASISDLIKNLTVWAFTDWNNLRSLVSKESICADLTDRWILYHLIHWKHNIQEHVVLFDCNIICLLRQVFSIKIPAVTDLLSVFGGYFISRLVHSPSVLLLSGQSLSCCSWCWLWWSYCCHICSGSHPWLHPVSGAVLCPWYLQTMTTAQTRLL